MKASLVIGIVSAAAVPMAIETGIGPLDPEAFGEDSDLFQKAQEIAKRDFAGAANVTVLEVEVKDQRTGAFGERIRPDVGYQFHFTKLAIQNTGKIDIAVSSWHFSGIDEAGSDHSIEMGGDHDDFDGARLGKGQTRVGTIIFELRKDSYLTGIRWQGDLAETNATVPAYPLGSS